MRKPYHIDLAQWLSVTVASAALLMSSCSSTGSISDAWQKLKNGDVAHADAIDPDLSLTRDDYKHLDAPKKSDPPPRLEIAKGVPPVPKIVDILAAPRPPKIGESQIVSIAVTDDVPLKDVLIELAKLADIDIELDAGITGGITFIAKDKPFNEVIDRIASLTGLRYSMKGGILRVERDTPYIKSYPVDFLNVDRDSDSAVSLSTNVLSGGGSAGGSGGSSGSTGGGGGSSGGLTTGSTSSVKTKSTGDFWKALETGIQQILAYQEPQHLSANVLQAESNANMPSPGGGGNAVPVAPPAPVQAPAPVQSGNAVDSKMKYTLNRQAGVLTVDGTDRQQELVEHFINELKKNASSQVLIEAKILEVDLSDQYASGVDWTTVGTRIGSVLGGGNITTQFSIPTPANPIVGVSPSTSFVQFAARSSSANIIQLLSAFGTTRTLSSPRLHAINNQQSTMTFATNHVYFTLTVTPATTTAVNGVTQTPSTATVTSSINTVPIGIMMTMMPSIDIANSEVTLSVRPTLSTITDFVNDPGFELQLAQASPTQVGKIHNAIPEIQVRELDSTLKLKSGETMVIGGLMQQEATNTDNGVPFVSGVPVIGNLFKNVAKSSHNKELVLLIKATIVDARGSLNSTDKNFFHKFSDDPRPVSF